MRGKKLRHPDDECKNLMKRETEKNECDGESSIQERETENYQSVREVA